MALSIRSHRRVEGVGSSYPGRIATVIVAALLFATGCSRDQGASVRSEGSGTGGGTGTGTGTATGAGTAAGTGEALGPYQPVSDVAAHAKISLDICDINALLPDGGPMNYDRVGTIYADGKNSVRSDGMKRTLKGFATGTLDEPFWKAYAAHFGDPAWLNTFAEGAIRGTGAFAGEPDAVRRQGIQKGIQNQIPIAWTLHELDAALIKAAASDGKEPATGAPHAVDEAWAFYHGQKPECSPYATADKRGADFGKGSAANDAIITQMKAALVAAREGSTDGLKAAVDEIVRQITITYVQAAIKYAAGIDAALKAGDAAKARAQQAEGWSFFRVIEPLVTKADPGAARTAAGVFDLKNGPTAGAGDAVRKALEGAYGSLKIEAAEIGSLKQ